MYILPWARDIISREVFFILHYITSHHITSHHITSHHISHHITSHHITHTIQYNTIQYNTIQYNTIQYNTIQYIFIRLGILQYNFTYNTIQYNTAPSLQTGAPILESATRESLSLQQSTFVPQHSVDVVSYFHSVWGSAALLNAHPKNSHAPGRALMFSSAWYPVYDPASRDVGRVGPVAIDRAL